VVFFLFLSLFVPWALFSDYFVSSSFWFRPSPRPDDAEDHGNNNNNNTSPGSLGTLNSSSSSLLDAEKSAKGKRLAPCSACLLRSLPSFPFSSSFSFFFVLVLVFATRKRQASHGEAERVLHWSSIPTTGDKITGRYGHTSVVFENYLYFFGGDGTSKRLNTVLRFDTETNALVEIPTKGDRPGPRSGTSAVVFGEGMYIFGGRDGNSTFDDIYVLKLSNRRWARVEPATTVRCPARFRHSSVVHNGRMYALCIFFSFLYFYVFSV
jgi:hypothetical protein